MATNLSGSGSLFYLGCETNRIFAYHSDANEETIPFFMRHDKRGRAEDMNNVYALMKQDKLDELPKVTSHQKRENYSEMDWMERLEYARMRPENLRTAVAFNQKRGYLQGKGLEYYHNSCENFIEEIKAGRPFDNFNGSQKGLMRCIIDAAFRRGDFSGLEDFGC